MPENDRRKKPQSFQATVLQVRYRQARAEAVAAGQAFTDASLAARLKCRAATISDWRRDPSFLEWIDTDARAAVEHLWGPVLLKAAYLALEGSVEHMRFLARFMNDGRSARVLSPVQVLVEVPRPPVNT
jgi:hypothetical protein